MSVSAPESDVDLFHPKSLANPFSDYRTLRDAGSVVRFAQATPRLRHCASVAPFAQKDA